MEQSQAQKLLTPHPLVAAAAKTGAGVRRITGYVGEAANAEQVRIFRSLSLEEYWDVARSDIMSVNEVAGSGGCVTLFIRSDARILHTYVGVGDQPRASGLTGDVLRRAMARNRRLSSRGFGRLGIGWTITVTIVTIISDDQGGDDDDGGT